MKPNTIFSPLGRDLFGDPIEQRGRGLIADRFTMPPFSVLNAREGAWQERRGAWLRLGIQSEIGRAACRPHGKDRRPAAYSGTDAYVGGDCWRGTENGSAASTFDPVLCELAYQWFCPPDGQIVDPFAGGSVRGIVAASLGYRYWGCDLSAVQIEANREQADKITPNNPPQWVCDDAIACLKNAPPADLIFTCPPYGDLERYSDDPRDLSTMEYHTFMPTFKRVLLRAAERLREDRFAVLVVGDFRDRRTGNYRGFVADTVIACREIGLALYNEGVLVTAVGSLPVRITRQFEGGRKLGKTHQNVLVFVKGDGKRAARAAQALRAPGQ